MSIVTPFGWQPDGRLAIAPRSNGSSAGAPSERRFHVTGEFTLRTALLSRLAIPQSASNNVVGVVRRDIPSHGHRP